jgi:hypothetical protein
VLEDDGLQRRGAADDRVDLGDVAAARDPQLDADHRPVAHAPVDLRQARLDVRGADIREAERPIVPVRQRLEHLVILPPQLVRTGVGDERVAHEDDDPFDAHPVGVAEQPRHLLLGRAALDAGQMTVQVPDPHGDPALG